MRLPRDFRHAGRILRDEHEFLVLARGNGHGPRDRHHAARLVLQVGGDAIGRLDRINRHTVRNVEYHRRSGDLAFRRDADGVLLRPAGLRLARSDTDVGESIARDQREREADEDVT